MHAAAHGLVRALSLVNTIRFSDRPRREVKSIRRSLFRLNPHAGARFTFFHDVWSNKFLFFAVTLGMLSVWPCVYIPTLNTNVFRHKAVTWELGPAIASVPTFIIMCELWKLTKRRLALFEPRRDAAGAEDALHV